MTVFTESIVEEVALAVLGRLGWAVLHGPEIAVGTAAAERSDPGRRLRSHAARACSVQRLPARLVTTPQTVQSFTARPACVPGRA